MTEKTTAAQKRATGTYRSKTIKKEITVNPEKNPALAKFINDEQYLNDDCKSFNQFAIGLIERHIDSDISQ